MKQPQLGQKILTLRQEKGLTQEELVERCHVSVRTIQRIEAGEVTPRSYTIKSILSALDYDFKALGNDNSSIKRNFNVLFHFNDVNTHSFYKELNIAWISGTLYLLLFTTQITLFFSGNWISFSEYVFVSIVFFAAFVFFMKGYIALAKYLKSNWLKTAAYTSIIINGLFYLTYIPYLFIKPESALIILKMSYVVFGISAVFLGMSFIKIQKDLGTIASIIGVLQLITAVFYLTITLHWIGLLFLNLALLFELILIYKIRLSLKSDQAYLKAA